MQSIRELYKIGNGPSSSHTMGPKMAAEWFKKNNKEVESEFMLNFSINRLSIKSGDEIYIKFVTDELYQNDKLLKESKIVASTIYYKDLFNVNYYDECELKENLMIL